MQDIECRQPHGQKVSIISLTQPAEPRRDPDSLRTALKYSASALKADGVRFALGGGYALWAHGGPEPNHDVDLVILEDDVPAAVRSLQSVGFDIERPPEDWLFKARRGDATVPASLRRGVPFPGGPLGIDPD